MTEQRKIIVYQADGRKSKILPSDFNKKIYEFIKTLTGDDYGAFFIYETNFLASDVHIPERLQIE